MRKINEVLRLKAEGLSIRDIAAAVGAGATTVYEYLHRAEAAGISWPLGPDLDEDSVEGTLFPALSAELEARRPRPDWRQVHREVKAGRHVTLRLVWLEWRADHPEGWGYSQFCWHYKRWLAAQDVVMRLSYAAGERMFVDFAGDKGCWVDPSSGGSTRRRSSCRCWAARGCCMWRRRAARTWARGWGPTFTPGRRMGVWPRSPCPTIFAPG